ncbi:SixA phosphatase family protein [Propionivibrio dicarboxylicus]|uniref:Phosphohistidine phosphatase, SixA n=1 Tax=Propionivibrio dicarboxylicus TaxID=83767 RepID=A0A1G8FCP0_9RHOO|nr:histidine phosphatase family protein [Propionivibrio dicarboxylicus]SDH79877.1 phosphohistidine phosphatase, SixA [Propionivibrio dicarboxylicus]
MDLLLWRHAEAEDGSPDTLRKLTPRGEKQARQVAAWLSEHLPKHLRIVASPALRCRQTAEALAQPFETDKRLAVDGNVTGLLVAAGWPDGGDTGARAVLVVGHQPILGRTAALLLSGEEADWTIKKSALWWFSNRTRHGETQTILKAVVSPELL